MNDPTPRIGGREEATDTCALPLVRRLAALLDRDPSAFRIGDPLPAGWHAILFTPAARQSDLGPDGHPRPKEQPAGPFPRRMLGGRRTQFVTPIPIGAELRRISKVVNAEEKQGRSGRLLRVTVRHAIHVGDDHEPAVIEDQDIIYREAASAAAAKPAKNTDFPAQAARPAPAFTRAFHPDPTLLFRYSAVTFNAHRIHYDHPYATTREAYPALVVNGGLTALLLLEMAKEAGCASPAMFSARNRLPLFCDRPARLCGAPDADGLVLWAEDEEGRTALEAHLR